MPERLNFRQACQQAGVSRQRLNQAIASGRLPAERAGGPGKPTYINQEDLQAWCVSEGLAMPVEAVERSERSQITMMPILMERLERLDRIFDHMERLERLVEQVLERLERSTAQAPPKPPRQPMSAPLSGDMFADAGNHHVPSDIPTSGDRTELINWMITAKDARRLSYQKITDALNAQGIPTFSGRGTWQKGNVERAYKGKTD
jgi:hypothetical protein